MMKAWMDQLRQGVPVDDIITVIRARLRTAKGEDRYELASNLRPFLTIAHRTQEELQLFDQMMKEFPDDVFFPISKASAYLYSVEDPEAALKWIDVALERAYRLGSFRRYALGVKARILLELSRGDDMSDVLEEIMSLPIKKGDPDIGRERDFVDSAPPGFIRKNVLERYNEFRPKRVGDTTEPLKFEPPDDAM